MFKRPDGRLVKSIDPFMKIIPYIMTTRTDSMNMMKCEIDCQPLDSYMEKQRALGVDVKYMDIIIAAMVRTIALRPALNRFIMNGRVYTRYKICVSFAIKRSLRDEKSDETTIKLEFEGHESIFEITKKIQQNVKQNKIIEEKNSTDRLASIIMSIPNPLIKMVVGVIKWMDKHNIMPSSVIEASPFHTSFFITNLKSIGLNYIYHHCYNFGTTGIFVSMGKERMQAAVIGNEIAAQKVITLGIVNDERFCDGLYLANSMRLLNNYLTDPKLLEQPLNSKIEDED